MNDSTALALRARDGDRLALGAFIRETQVDVWRTCRNLGPAEAADDLTQETYVRAMKSIANFRGDSSGRTWIIGIARHVAMDAWRSEQRKRRLADALLRQRTAEVVIDLRGEYEDLFSALDPNQAAAFHLTQVLGFSYAEAAQTCGCEIGTIRSRVARARSQLIELLHVDLEPAKTQTQT